MASWMRSSTSLSMTLECFDLLIALFSGSAMDVSCSPKCPYLWSITLSEALCTRCCWYCFCLLEGEPNPIPSYSKYCLKINFTIKLKRWNNSSERLPEKFHQSLILRVTMNVIIIFDEINFIWPAVKNQANKWFLQVSCNLSNCRKEAWKILDFDRI